MSPGVGPLGPGQPGGPRVRLVPGALEVADAAARARTWGELAAGCRSCTACPELVASRRTVVVGEVPAGARAVLVGEAPGAQEDAAGRRHVVDAVRLGGGMAPHVRDGATTGRPACSRAPGADSGFGCSGLSQPDSLCRPRD